MKEKIAVIGANAPLIPFYRQAKKLGYQIIGIAWEQGAVCKPFCDKFYPISFAEKDKVLDVCRKEHIDGITSFSLESALPTVVYVAQSMGLVSNSEECLRLTQSKYAQRQALEEAGIPVPKYYLIGSANQLQDIDCRFPVIVKPVDSGGSQGICKVEKADDLLASYQYAVDYSRSGKVIVEEFVDGREFSVEYISCQGRHYFLQITDKVTSGAPRFVELQHHQPAQIPSSVWERIKTMVENALTALKIENSASHTEIKLNTDNELFIIETGARMGGDFITSDLVRLSTGYDMVKGTLELATGCFKVPKIENKHFSGVYFYSSLTPEVKRFIDNAKDYPLIVDAACQSEELKECQRNGDRNGHFLYQSDQKFLF